MTAAASALLSWSTAAPSTVTAVSDATWAAERHNDRGRGDSGASGGGDPGGGSGLGQPNEFVLLASKASNRHHVASARRRGGLPGLNLPPVSFIETVRGVARVQTQARAGSCAQL